jgi:hypothetical protein
MELYSVILYAHIVCAMGMAAGVAILMVEEAAARRASTPGELRTIRRMRKATGAATSAGAITPAVRQMLNDPVLATMGRQRVALLALLPFLMTTKPGWAVTLAAFVIAITLGALSGVLHPQKSREATEAT